MTNEASMSQPLDHTALDPKRANEWMALAAGCIGVLIWFWRHALKQAYIFLVNLASAPNNIADIKQTLHDHDYSIKTALARSRITWNGLTKPVWESDPTGFCIFANTAMLNLLKRRESEILGRSWVSIIHEEDRERVTKEWDDAISERRDFDLRYRWVGSDGTVYCIHAKASRLLDPAGVTLGHVAFVTVEDTEGFKKGQQT